MARRSYSKEQKQKVLAEVAAEGLSSAARKHGVPVTTVHGWMKQSEDTGQAKERPREETSKIANADKQVNKATKRRKYTEQQKQEVVQEAMEMVICCRASPAMHGTTSLRASLLLRASAKTAPSPTI